MNPFDVLSGKNIGHDLVRVADGLEELNDHLNRLIELAEMAIEHEVQRQEKEIQ